MNVSIILRSGNLVVSNMQETFNIVIGGKGIAWMLVMDFVLIAIFVHLWGKDDLSGLWRWTTLATVGAVTASLLLFTAGAFFSKITVFDDSLKISIPFYARTVLLSAVDAQQIAVVSFDDHKGYKPSFRTNGLGVPGYGVGWFLLRDGTRALVAIGSADNAVYIPTSEGFSILATIENPDSFVSLITGIPSEAHSL